jgi:hypothetical protein
MVSPPNKTPSRTHINTVFTTKTKLIENRVGSEVF